MLVQELLGVCKSETPILIRGFRGQRRDMDAGSACIFSLGFVRADPVFFEIDERVDECIQRDFIMHPLVLV